ncbi:hypothetical protein MMC26_001804 [Xylographa opegraphella]|nr:hypothetical protein [Xylographa opegraphella]
MSLVGPTASVLVASVGLYFAYLLVSALYSVFFHPLRKFPGPPFAAASYLPYALHLANGTFSVWVKDLHQQYKSDVVRLSPRDLSFIGASAWKDISGYRAGHRPFDRDVAVYGKPVNGVDTLLTADRLDHPRMRRVLDHAFSSQALKEQDSIILGTVDKFIQCLTNQASQPSTAKVDMAKWFNWMTFDLIGDLAFGESFNCLEEQVNHPWVQMIFGNLQGIVYLNACSRFSLLASILPYLIPSRIKKMIEEHWQLTLSMLRRRIDRGTKRRDFVSPILENNTKKTLKPGEMEANASLFMIAGSDSVAASLAGATWYLMRNPDVLEKLRHEIDEYIQVHGEITIRQIDQLPYLAAVVNEAWRIYPVALAGQASIVPSGGDTISGYWIPGNTGVSMNQYAVYRSSMNFAEPDTFAPTRWLGDPRFSTDKKEAFHPFSMGPRNCIARILGLSITRFTLASLVRHFDLELSPETDASWPQQKSFIVWQKKPLMIRLARRATEKVDPEARVFAKA